MATAPTRGLPAERERTHREAARALMDAGADADLVACHLLECGPHADPEVSAHLVRAASAAAQRGAPHAAAAYLDRALEERAPSDDRGQMLAQLATVAFDAGLPDSRRRLREALREIRDRGSRIDVLTRLAALNVIDAGDAGLAQVVDQELVAERDPHARLAVETVALDTLMMIPGRHAERARRVAAVDLAGTTDPLLVRVVLAHRAWVGTELGRPGADACAELALAALDGDLLLAEAWRRPAHHLCARVLVMTDHHEAAARAIGALRDDAMTRGSLPLRAAAAWYAAELALRTGRVTDAEAHARLALDIVGGELNLITGGAVEVLVCALVERGALQEARELLAERGLDGALGPAEPGVDGVALDRRAGARAPRPPRRGRRAGRCRAGARRALRGPRADRRRAARPRGRAELAPTVP